MVLDAGKRRGKVLLHVFPIRPNSVQFRSGQGRGDDLSFRGAAYHLAANSEAGIEEQ